MAKNLTNGPDTFVATKDADVIHALQGNDTVIGMGGDDVIYAGPDYAIIPGLSDDDYIVGDAQDIADGDQSMAGNDTIYGGYGNDTIYGDSTSGRSTVGGNDYIDGGSGNDYIAGGSGNDSLMGGDGDDVIYGDYELFDSGNDYINGGTGNDKMIGGIGNDQYVVDSSGDVVVENAGAGYGVDIVMSYVNNYILAANVEDLEVRGTAATGVGNDLNNRIWGNAGNNNLFGQAGNDTLIGEKGNDNLWGGAGFDTAGYSGYYTNYTASFTSDGSVQITGSEGTDLLIGIERINFNDGGYYNVYTGDGGNNSITADPNVWSFQYGGGGNDSLTGGIYNDTLAGGNGNDKLVGGAGYDTAIYFGKYSDFTYTVSLNSDGSVKVAGSEGTDTLTGIERINFTGDGGAFDVFTGDGSNNTFTAYDYVAALMYGAGGNDTMTGSIYDDSLLGGAGTDNLVGGSGRDLLVGGSGRDILTGGAGADKFRFGSVSEGIDLIKDFSYSAGDKVEIVKSSFGATSLSQFSYNSTTGALLFGSTQFATLENKPTGFSVQNSVVLV